MNELMKRFCEGDQDAFKELFWTLLSSGRRFIKNFVIDKDLGDDILQEVFIQIWNKRKTFQSEEHLRAYFYKSLRNNIVKSIVRNKHTSDLETALDRESEDVFVQITDIEFNREISRAISLLPEKRREIIQLSMAGMSEQMIADALNISVNTVKNQKTKAYASLRRELKDINHFLYILTLV